MRDQNCRRLVDSLLQQKQRLESCVRAVLNEYDELHRRYQQLKTKQTAVEREYQFRLKYDMYRGAE